MPKPAAQPLNILASIVPPWQIHIAPFAACQGLVAGAGACLAPGGRLVFYGPFRWHGLLAPESNVNFDLSLKERCACARASRPRARPVWAH